MATLYDAADSAIATGFTVLLESSLMQRRTDIVHDPVTGGLPYVVLKDPGGLAGNLELLCPSKANAEAVYDAHLGGLLRLEDTDYALDFWYVPVGGAGLPTPTATSYWRVSVLGVQEVAP
ncbi:hypothetical protein [Promicromonospora sp. NPDC050880]|uniref:hypothetical protein n=1 Tax=Promicromonospora sp. NPDC050880 TaxID=3364406 RepID=UPI0037905D89